MPLFIDILWDELNAPQLPEVRAPLVQEQVIQARQARASSPGMLGSRRNLRNESQRSSSAFCIVMLRNNSSLPQVYSSHTLCFPPFHLFISSPLFKFCMGVNLIRALAAVDLQQTSSSASLRTA